MVGHPNGGFGVQHHEIHKVKATVEAAARSEHHDALESMGIKHKYSTKMANGTNEHEFSGHHDHFKQLHKHLKGQGYKHTKLGIKAKFGMFKKDNHKVIYDHKKDSVLRVVHTHS
jgi:DNA polymerase/3'-5' exonuclease PolX